MSEVAKYRRRLAIRAQTAVVITAIREFLDHEVTPELRHIIYSEVRKVLRETESEVSS